MLSLAVGASPAATRSSPAAQNRRPIYSGFIAELDGYRGIGVLFVFLAHFFPESALRNWLQVSWFFMDGFFVLSGFLIVGTLLDSRDRSDFFRRFYLRRTLRIFPAYYTVVGLLILGLLVSGRYASFVAEWASPLWFLVYLGTIPSVLLDAFPRVGSFAPLWSLQIEEQFYMLAPLAVRGLSADRLRRLLLGLVCLSPLLRVAVWLAFPDNAHLPYAFLPCRFEGFALGALVALRFREGPWDLTGPRLGWLTLASFAITLSTAGLAGWDWPQPWNRTLGYLLASFSWACAFVWLINHRGSRATAFLRSAPAQYCARLSYGIYLLHWPVSAAVGKGLAAAGLALPPLIVLLAQAAATIATAAVCWKLIEAPALALKDRLEPAQPARAA